MHEDFGNVSETDEEWDSESSNEHVVALQAAANKGKTKTYSIGYLTKTIRSNKIFSDDFDADFDQ